MDLDPGFKYNPVSPTPDQPAPAPPPVVNDSDLGPLTQLPGVWKGTGFNAIWRPSNVTQDRFLELNLTTETLQFDRIPGTIPNRGLLQPDILMTGVRYLQEISDSNLNAGLHIEPGIWLSVPATTDPKVEPSVVRMASIPHGTTVVAQGQSFVVNGQPVMSPINFNPFPIGNPSGAFTFPEQDLTIQTDFRTPAPGLVGITQDMINDPHSILRAAIQPKTVTAITVLQVTSANTPIVGGGTANTAFLEGTADGPNADAALVTSTFWIETIEGQERPQLQYTQLVLLNFNGLSWPHVTVATLTKQPA